MNQRITNHPNKGKRNVKDGQSLKKWQNIRRAQILYLNNPEGLRDDELAEQLGVLIRTASQIRVELGAVRTHKAHYTLKPSEADVTLARAILRRAGLDDLPVGESDTVPAYEILIRNPLVPVTDYSRITRALGDNFHHFGARRIDGLPVYVKGYYGEAVAALNALGFETDEDGE